MTIRKNLLILFLTLICASASQTAFAEKERERSKDDSSKSSFSIKEEWDFYYFDEDPTETDLKDLTQEHKLGKEVAYYSQQIKDLFVYKETVVPGDPTQRTVIRKPDIYNAVRTIEKELVRSVKSGDISESEAASELKNVMVISLASMGSDSETFETMLGKNKKDIDKLLAIFDHVNVVRY